MILGDKISHDSRIDLIHSNEAFTAIALSQVPLNIVQFNNIHGTSRIDAE